jgi:hypothetical protein
VTTLIAVTSDIHAGSTVAVCPETISLDDGGHYAASKAQQWLWSCWQKYWDRVAQRREEESARLITVFNGDIVDGDHHNTSQLVSRNPNAQAAITNACMSVPLDMRPDKILVIRGTEAHTGQSASAEERIADGLWRDKRPIVRDESTGTASWWHYKGACDGIPLDITHHGRTGQREHTRGSAAVLHAHDIMSSYVKRGERPPQLCFRGHHHKWNDSHDACPVRVITTGAWQLKTGYVHKVAADSMADIAHAIVTIRNGEYHVEKVQFLPEPAPLHQL